MTKIDKIHVEEGRDRDNEEIVTFHYNHTQGRASLIMHQNPSCIIMDPALRRNFRVMVTGVPVARSAIIDLGSELELRSVRLHYQYDIHSVTSGDEPAHVIISYLLAEGRPPRRAASTDGGPPNWDPCFVNLFKFVGPLPPPQPVIGTARVPPHTVARYIRIQTTFRPCVAPFDPRTKGPAWRVVEIEADSLPPSPPPPTTAASPHGDGDGRTLLITSPRPAAATRTAAHAAPRAPAQSG